MTFDDYEVLIKGRFEPIPGLEFSAINAADGIDIRVVVGESRGKDIIVWRTTISDGTIRAASESARDVVARLIERPVQALRDVVSAAEARGHAKGEAAGRKAAIEELRANATLLRELKV